MINHPILCKEFQMKMTDSYIDRYTYQKYSDSIISIELNCRGENEYNKFSYPVKYGIFSRLETCDHIFEFNLNHELCHAKAKTRDWIHPSEWLKRTAGNDWVYYSSGGYAGVFEAIGEYYLPNLTYPTNSLLGGKPFKEPFIEKIVTQWPTIIEQIDESAIPDPFLTWLQRVKQQGPQILADKAQTLFNINGSRVTVMPPDARHVDYNMIPITIADGCLYKCPFCKIKNQKPFSVRSNADIDAQITALASLYDADVLNYNAIFLGEHDALNAGESVIINAIDLATEKLNFGRSYMADQFVFLFASVDSILDTPLSVFKQLNTMDIRFFVNVGIESFDDETLKIIGKPLSATKIDQAFEYIQNINQTFSNIEITCNIIMDESLPDSHHTAFLSKVRQALTHPVSKGTIYFSPLKFGQPSRPMLYDFYRLKRASRYPTYLYIIQRL